MKRDEFFYLTISLLMLFSLKATSQNLSDNNNNNTDCVEFDGSMSVKSCNAMSSALKIISVIPSPTTGTSSLEYDGSYLWVGSNPNKIFKISPLDGSIIKILNTSVQRPYGLTYINGYLWVADNNLHKIHKIDTSNGNSVLSFNSLYQGYDGDLTWDGVNLWHNDSNADSVYVFDTLATRIDAHKINLTIPSGLTFENNNLWVSDNATHKLYKVDTSSFIFLDTIISPRHFPNGLAFDGQYLWIAENENGSGFDSIYQIDIGINTGIIKHESSFADIFSIYPNPSSGIVYVTSEKIIDEIKISDLIGQIIYQSTPNEKNLSLQLDKAGVYFITLKYGKQTKARKLIVYH